MLGPVFIYCFCTTILFLDHKSAPAVEPPARSVAPGGPLYKLLLSFKFFNFSVGRQRGRLCRSILAGSICGTSSFIFGLVRRSGWVCVCRDFGAESFWRSIGASVGYLSAVTGGRANYNFPFIIISRKIFWPARKLSFTGQTDAPNDYFINHDWP